MLLVLILIPAVSGLAAFAIVSDTTRRRLLPAAAVLHASATLLTWIHQPAPLFAGWLMLDAPGRLFLSIASVIFLAAAVYASGYLPNAHQGRRHDGDDDEVAHGMSPERVFTGCLLLFLASMTLITVSAHFGLLWVAVEASTLASAPLIYFHRDARSLEATWKYLMVCSVGVALALLGNFFLAVAAESQGLQSEVLLGDLMALGERLQPTWLKAAFLFFLVGYGTKMGLAPLHNWLPDAHSEAPALVSALLSGALLNCAFLAILRVLQVCEAAGLGDFARELLVLLGLLSVALAAVFIIGQRDYKRMLAYSSVEHMGILALGIGLGGAATFGALLHAINHSFTKAMLFLVAGNILAVYSTKSTVEVRGLFRVLPVSGALWMAGFLALTGSPPFGPFISEFTIFKAALDQGHAIIAVVYLGLLGILFVGMSAIILGMTQGHPDARPALCAREPRTNTAPAVVLCGAVLVLGVYLPAPLRALLHEAAATLGGW